MKTTCAVLLILMLAGCTAGQRGRFREGYRAAEYARADRQYAAMQQQAAANAIIVTPGDLAGRKYDILGSVDYPGRGVTMVSFTGSPATCGPDDARKAAVGQYGQVDAIIGFTQWRDGSTQHCGGTAVRFAE